MPDTRFKPVPVNESSASDEESQLELYLQKQLEEDVARIFDESIYSDLEVVCGKLKILTHSCILKARTHKFYHNLQTILHVNIDRHIFDEIYSYISDAYTECDIKKQEIEIIKYLKSNFIILNSVKTKSHAKEEDAELYLTPKCVSPYGEDNILKSNVTSPNTELTKEYYALVPIEGNLLDQELNEQDALSDAFQTIIKTQHKSLSVKNVQHTKPTTLSLTSSHTAKTVKHSISCDIINNCRSTYNVDYEINGEYTTNKCAAIKKFESRDLTDQSYNNLNSIDLRTEQNLTSTCSPDSLITDDPSSSSDYLSAAPGLGSIEFFPQLYADEKFSKMNNIFASSDSGLENTGILDTNKDITTTDVSLTESTLHDLATEDTNPSLDCYDSFNPEHILSSREAELNTADSSARSHTAPRDSGSNGLNDVPGKKDPTYSRNTKEEKQRMNEEIVILESSSISSETGSWESVFPPKGSSKEICEKFISNERLVNDQLCTKPSGLCSESVTANEKIEIKPTPCFIDASSLVDEENYMKVPHVYKNECVRSDTVVPTRPLPCSTAHKSDISPIDWSENNDDSLEQPLNIDSDSIQRDLSPTIFEMTPIIDDSFGTNVFEMDLDDSADEPKVNNENDKVNDGPYMSTLFLVSTPNNSILSVQPHTDQDPNDPFSSQACDKLSSGDTTSIITDGTTRTRNSFEGSSHSIESTMKSNKLSELLNNRNDIQTSSWVVDMSIKACNNSKRLQKPSDRTCEDLKSDRYDLNNKSHSSVDSDSEKSSHKFYIDLSSLPDTLALEKTESESSHEKKNIFSMYIELGENGSVKEMPSRLSSSLNAKKQCDKDKAIPKPSRTAKKIIENNHKVVQPHISDVTQKSIAEDSFEKIESLCNDPNISITEIINLPVALKRKNDDKDLSQEKIASNKSNEHRKTKLITVIPEESDKTFVKLSDLDKPVTRSDIAVHVRNDDPVEVRMTRSIPDNNWGKGDASSRCDVLSSFHSENALSLNRLFPHLKNTFSRSMPGSLSVTKPSKRGASFSEADDHVTADVSELSSVQSSVCRSVVENSTTEDTSQTSSLIANCQSRLGQDLLRMFLEEIAPDVIVEVSGKRIKAHKCILSSRCQYFAGILSGGWVESAGNIIVLPPFSFNVVHFALCHIYSGISAIPDTLSIVELATIADMLCLEGLKEAIMFTLKAKYCHHFHKPCQICSAGVLECLTLSSVYGLDDLYRKCLRWIMKYFPKVWPTKPFATLPKELFDKCYQEVVVNLSMENVIDTVYGCGITVASLPNSRWAETVARMCRRVVNAAAHFTAPRLFSILKMISSLSDDMHQSAYLMLDECLMAAIEWAPPEETCRSYAFLTTLIIHYATTSPTSKHFLRRFVNQWRVQCESSLVRSAPRVVGTLAFKELSPNLRKRLRELGCIMYGPQTVPLTASPLQDRKSRSVYQNKPVAKHAAATRSLDLDHVRSSLAPLKMTQTVNRMKSESREKDKTIPKVRTTKAQEQRAKYNQTKTVTQDRSVKPVVRPYENTKPRYMEPKVCKEEKKQLLACPKKSSDSSRNSSPVLMKNFKRAAKMKAISQDSLMSSSRPRTAEPSTDSLSESNSNNKYATFTKTKHTGEGSVESVRSTKPHTSSAQNVNAKTKIPVLSQSAVTKNYDRHQHEKTNMSPSGNNANSAKLKNKGCIRSIPGSLMNATKSSSAKMVTKIVKDVTQSKINKKSPKASKDDTVRLNNMKRSNTFLKDEPTFGDKTTNIDVDH
ncbi:unnamed protein product [Leptosia nina]|uniref:BTB domain-containing protein n=1 Tax=Leptosia nina TaxID=320188 RepID=A0AAV1K057_9NEOP